MDKPPTDPKPSAEPEDAPEQLDADVRRDVLRAAETCRERFEASPSRSDFQLGEILKALGRYPHLIDPVHRFIESKNCPSRFVNIGPAPVVKIGGEPVPRVATTKDPKTGEDVGEDEFGFPVYGSFKDGRSWEGHAMLYLTRQAIEDYSDPLDVAAAVIRHLPPMLRTDCDDANRDPDQVGLAIANLIVDDETGKQPRGWRDPKAVLRAILRELGHPRPGNVTRD
jgi:hypothetical protein